MPASRFLKSGHKSALRQYATRRRWLRAGRAGRAITHLDRFFLARMGWFVTFLYQEGADAAGHGVEDVASIPEVFHRAHAAKHVWMNTSLGVFHVLEETVGGCNRQESSSVPSVRLGHCFLFGGSPVATSNPERNCLILQNSYASPLTRKTLKERSNHTQLHFYQQVKRFSRV